MTTATLLPRRRKTTDTKTKLIKLQLDLELMWSEIEEAENPVDPADMPSDMVIDRMWRNYRELEREELALKARLVAETGTLRRKGL
jgi:hypothetical protein